ncbi:MAG TPA: MFS transporter [Solirubrobacteraceae bacterium]|nr:MFS transporter [Solirubrobacteraceae bacterium]
MNSGAVSAEDLHRLDNTEGLDQNRGKVLMTACMGFFTDAYDLFIIGLVLVILKKEWGVTGGIEKLLASSIALLTAAIGAWAFGRLADRFGRKSVYGWEMLVLAGGALASAFSPNIWWLIVFRAILGFGVGGDYPVSSTIMSEYAGKKDRGKMVALVFSAQGIGLVVGPLLAVVLLAAGVSPSLTWRILLGLGALPALSVFWMRRQIAETPRFRLAQQQAEEQHQSVDRHAARTKLWHDRVLLRWLFGAAITWFLFDFAYYGDTIASDSIVKKVVSHATPLQTSGIELGIFAIFSLPAFYLAAFTIDRIGRRLLQIIGFVGIAVFFALVWAIPGASTATIPFILLFGATYFFSQWGPNTTTFVYPSEIFPVDVRTTGNGIASGVAKLGAFAGAAVLPALVDSMGISQMVLIPAAVALAGALFTLTLPEPKGKTLEEISDTAPSRSERGPDPIRSSAGVASGMG